MKRLAPVLVLFVLSPLVAEFLSGSTSLAGFATMLVFLPLYGFGAILVREIARRTQRGWLAMPFLALAYGLIEEGVVLQSLFNKNFMGAHLLDTGFVPGIGIGGPWTVYVLGIHIFWSILAPVALTEVLFPSLRTTPWLNRIGLSIVAILYIALAAILTFGMAAQTQFFAAPAQLALVALAIAATAALAFAFPAQTRSTAAPSPWRVALASFVGGSAFLLLYSQGVFVLFWPWQGVTAGLLAILLLLLTGIVTSARRTGWTLRHSFAATAGCLAVYCWFGFVTDATLHGTEALGPHAILTAAMVTLLTFAGIRTFRSVADGNIAS